MKFLVVAHIGETLGHLVRASSVCTELLRRGTEVHLACSSQAIRELWSTTIPRVVLHDLTWRWSHNAWDLNKGSAALLARVSESATDVERVALEVKPDLILGFPGMVSALVARRHRIPHVSVAHAPYLVPFWEPSGDRIERAVYQVGRRVCALADRVAEFLHEAVGTPALTYEEFLATESVFVPQPALPLEGAPPSIRIVDFIRGSYGPPMDNVALGDDCCYVSFGSGNPCDLSEIVAAVREIWPQVVVTTGLRSRFPATDGVVVRRAVASESLAGRVHAVISHGGLGTIGTFAESGTRQMIIPTEFDQVTTALYARRRGLAQTLGLSAWLERVALGRQLPPLTRTELANELAKLRCSIPPPKIPADGASQIAAAVC